MFLLKTFFVSLSAVVFATALGFGGWVSLSAVVLATALGFGGWKAYNNYSVFSNEELEVLAVKIVESQCQAYQLGAQSCNKNSSL